MVNNNQHDNWQQPIVAHDRQTDMDALVGWSDDGTPTTTSLIVANGTESQHRAVLQLIKNNMQDFEEFGGVAFEMRPFETAGGTQSRSVAVLNREHAMLLMTYMRNTAIVRDFKKRLIHSFVALEKRAHAPVAALPDARQLAEMVIAAEDRADQATAELKAAAPAIEYHDEFVADDDLLTFSTVASSLVITEKRLREMLIDHKWIYRETRTRWSNSRGKKIPVNRYTECAGKKEYFARRENHDVPRFGNSVMHTLFITPRGAVAVSRAVHKWLAAETPDGQETLDGIGGAA